MREREREMEHFFGGKVVVAFCLMGKLSRVSIFFRRMARHKCHLGELLKFHFKSSFLFYPKIKYPMGERFQN